MKNKKHPLKEIGKDEVKQKVARTNTSPLRSTVAPVTKSSNYKKPTTAITVATKAATTAAEVQKDKKKLPLKQEEADTREKEEESKFVEETIGGKKESVEDIRKLLKEKIKKFELDRQSKKENDGSKESRKEKKKRSRIARAQQKRALRKQEKAAVSEPPKIEKVEKKVNNSNLRDLQFGVIRFEGETIKKKKYTDPKQALAQLEKDPKVKDAWRHVTALAKGINPQDDEVKLKRTVKRREVEKKSRKKQWSERTAKVRQGQEKRQKTRQQNIEQRKEQKQQNKRRKKR